MEERYRHFNNWLKNKFGERTLKICVDGGFTCPNRDGKCGYGGCIFCGERGSGENTKRVDIRTQVKSFLSSYRGVRANKFIVYFQNFSNTYDEIDVLKDRYNQALCDDRIVGLSVATRPDCINEEVAKLLASYKNKYYVMVEFGLQTANENTGKLINRGYTNQDFVNAVQLLKKYDIDVVAHIMVGLPGESEDDVLKTIEFLNNLEIMGIKIHSCYILKNTNLEKMYLNKDYVPITQDYYVSAVANIIKKLRKDIVVCRISGDPPKNDLVAPEWQTHKKLVINAINNSLKNQDIIQGGK